MKTKHRGGGAGLQAAEAPWAELILVCSKCAAKLGRGARGKSDLRSEIKTALKASGRHDVRVADTTCLDLCPKNGQAIAFAAQGGGLEVVIAPGDMGGEAVARHVSRTVIA